VLSSSWVDVRAPARASPLVRASELSAPVRAGLRGAAPPTGGHSRCRPGFAFPSFSPGVPESPPSPADASSSLAKNAEVGSSA
jgi:hypothetical protein